jgi:ceramide glucosyltransferase
MATLFYVLVIAQIALGIYSLWNGFEWFRMVRRRLTSHAGFYAPTTALICPCKGNERGLEDNLTALTRFEYANYEIYFTLATSLDPALKIIERVKAASSKPVHIVIAGPPEDCSEKVFNLRRTVEALPANFEVLVFTDSDVRLPRGWLTKLVAPLQDARVGATTAYRWIIPSGQFGAGAFSSALASAWNAAIATMLGKQSDNFCWGGGTAIRRSLFDQLGVVEEWKSSVSDDYSLTRLLHQAGRSIMFLPDCLTVSYVEATFASLLEFTNRQILITRVYAEQMWAFGFATHTLYCLTLVLGILLTLGDLAAGLPAFHHVMLTFLPVLLGMMRSSLRVAAVTEVLPALRGQIMGQAWIYIVLTIIIPFLYLVNFVTSLITRKIRWRTITYELISPNQTRILAN